MRCVRERMLDFISWEPCLQRDGESPSLYSVYSLRRTELIEIPWTTVRSESLGKNEVNEECSMIKGVQQKKWVLVYRNKMHEFGYSWSVCTLISGGVLLTSTIRRFALTSSYHFNFKGELGNWTLTERGDNHSPIGMIQYWKWRYV